MEGVFPSTSNASASEEQVKVRRDRKRASSGYRDEKRRSPKNSFREHSYLPQPAQRERPDDHAIEITEVRVFKFVQLKPILYAIKPVR